MHSRGVGLHHRRVAVDVDNQAREEVPLAMHEAEAIVVVALQVEGASEPHGVGEASGEEVVREGFGVKLEHTDGDAPYLIVSYADYTAVVGHHCDTVALLDAVADTLHGAGEYPGVEPLERFLFTLFQFYLFGHCCSVAGIFT